MHAMTPSNHHVFWFHLFSSLPPRFARGSSPPFTSDHYRSVPYSHEENGIAERGIKTMQEHLRAFLFDRDIKHRWSIFLPMVQRIITAEYFCPAALLG